MGLQDCQADTSRHSVQANPATSDPSSLQTAACTVLLSALNVVNRLSTALAPLRQQITSQGGSVCMHEHISIIDDTCACVTTLQVSTL